MQEDSDLSATFLGKVNNDGVYDHQADACIYIDALYFIPLVASYFINPLCVKCQ